MKKLNGTGTLYLRERIWWVKLYVDGKPIYASTKSTKVSDAKRCLDQMIAKKVRGELNGDRPDKVLIGELLDDVLESDIAESTRKIWRLVTEANIRPFFGSMKAARLTSDIIEQYREKRVANPIGSSPGSAGEAVAV